MNNYQKFIEAKHKQFTTSAELIHSVITESTGKSIAEKVRLVVGEHHEVYIITLTGGNSVVLRIDHADYQDFWQEQWAIGQALAIGLPAPKFILMKHIRKGTGYLSFCVMERLSGHPLLPVTDERAERVDGYVKKMVSKSALLLAKIHSISTRGFGRIDGNGVGQYPSLSAMILEKVAQEEHLLQLAEETGFEKQKMIHILTILSEHQSLYEVEKPVLNHGDFGPKHIMVQGDTITGIIDRGEAASNTPVYDFAYWDYWRGDILPIALLKDAYPNKSIFDDQFESLMSIFKLYLGIGLLYHYRQAGYQSAIEKVKLRFDRDLTAFN